MEHSRTQETIRRSLKNIVECREALVFASVVEEQKRKLRCLENDTAIF